MLRRSNKTILLAVLVVALAFLAAGLLILNSTSRINPDVLEVWDPSVDEGVFRCELVDRFNSANRFDRFEAKRNRGEVLVGIYVGLRRYSGHPDGFECLEIELEPNDRLVILTDGVRQRIIWSR